MDPNTMVAIVWFYAMAICFLVATIVLIKLHRSNTQRVAQQNTVERARLQNQVTSLTNQVELAQSNLDLAIAENKIQLKRAVEEGRKEAILKSRQVRRGIEGENFVPLHAVHWCHKDFRHVGAPIDYIIYDGATDIHDGVGDDIKEIILLDIKTGPHAGLNKVQRRIRDAVVAGRVRFATYNPDKVDAGDPKGVRYWPEYPEVTVDEDEG